MRILLTGHLGFIGGYLFDRLVRDGHKVFGIDKKGGKDILSCDLPEVDLVYHLAAQTSVINSVDNPTEDALDNIVGTIKIAERYKDTKIVYTSSAGAIQKDILSPYGLSKYVGEQYLDMLHKNHVICRFPNVCGKGGKGVVEIFKETDELKIYGDGLQSRDFVHVDDIVEGLVLAKDWANGLYELGCEKSTTVLDIAKMFKKPYKFYPEREGELRESVVRNTTINWKPKVKIEDYINEI